MFDISSISEVISSQVLNPNNFIVGADVISRVFDESIMPYVYDIGKLLLKVGIVQGAYYVMRADRKAGIEKIKYASFGYIMLKFIDVFINIIDEISANITM